MKTNNKVVLFFLGLVLQVGLAHADEHGEEKAGFVPVFAPVAIFACNYKKGKDREDLDKVIADWNAWLDETKAEPYTAWVYTPYYGSPDYDFDIAWLGAWPDAKVMGIATDHWLQNGGKLEAAFNRVVQCDLHANFATTPMRQTDTSALNSAVLTFSDCKLKKKANMGQAMQAIHKWNKYQLKQGSKGNEWLFFPVYGAAADYRFKWVTAHANYTDLGADYERYANGGGYLKGQEMLADKISCGTSRVYNAERVRGGVAGG